jgi:hypothetical protein
MELVRSRCFIYEIRYGNLFSDLPSHTVFGKVGPEVLLLLLLLLLVVVVVVVVVAVVVV